MNIVADIFYLHRVLFNNILRWLLAATKLVLSIHIFACFWVLIHRIKDLSAIPSLEFRDSTIFEQYVTAVYLMTSTISTVGYGDYDGFSDNSGNWTKEMIYLFFLQFVGIILFSSVTHEIFSYKKSQNVRELV